MREKNRNSIAIPLKIPQFTTMNVIDGQAGLVLYSSLIFYSLTINNILNIIVLLILAGVTIATLTGDNGLLNKSKRAAEENKKAEALELIKTKVMEVQAEKNGSATLQDFVEYLSNDTSGEYTISLAQTSSINGTLPEGIASAEKIYVTYNGFEFEVTKNFNIEIVGGTASTSGGSQTGGTGGTGGETGGGSVVGGCSRYIKVRISAALMESMILDVDIPETDNVKTIHYYVEDKEVYSGPEKTYTVTGLENNKTYHAYAIVEYENEKEISQATILPFPAADLYVSTTGSDAEGTGSATAPFATIAKAIDTASSTSKTSIYVCPGTYDLAAMPTDDYGQAGIADKGKNLEIFGQNEKTILTWDATKSKKRDSPLFALGNSNTIVRNLTYVATPRSNSNIDTSIFRWCNGTVKNIFFRIAGKYSSAYSYYNGQSKGNPVINCTFFHDTGAILGNYSGGASYTNVATNKRPANTTSPAVVEKSFGNASTSLSDLIKNSKNDEDFIANQAGVFYGDNAWN